MVTAPVEVLLADLEAQAEAERAKVRDEAAAKVVEIRARADAEIRRIEEEATRRLVRLVALERERIEGRFRIEERRRMLEARRAALAAVFTAARTRLGDRLRGPAYKRVLERLVAEALAAVGGEADVEVCREDAGAARAIIAGLAGLAAGAKVVERGEEPGTVIAVSRDGLRRFDNSARRRLDQAERLLEDEVARELTRSGGAALS